MGQSHVHVWKLNTLRPGHLHVLLQSQLQMASLKTWLGEKTVQFGRGSGQELCLDASLLMCGTPLIPYSTGEREQWYCNASRSIIRTLIALDALLF